MVILEKYVKIIPLYLNVIGDLVYQILDQNDHTYCVEDVHVSKSSAMDEVPPIVQANVTSTEDKEKATLIINSRLRNSIEQLIVDEIKTVCNKLVTKTEERSVLGIVRPMSVLAKESGDLVPKLIKELSTRYVTGSC